MKILFYSVKDFEKPFLQMASLSQHQSSYIKEALGPATTQLAEGFDAVSIFTGDDASAAVIKELSRLGIQFIATRAAGYDNIDIATARQHHIRVANVPEYSPYAIAEHAVALLLAVNRKLVLADQQVHAQNYTVDHLVGFDLHEKTIGIIGLGKIGGVFAKIMHGFGSRLLAYDVEVNDAYKKEYNVQYVSLEALCAKSDVISIHVPLNEHTKYMIGRTQLQQMKDGVIIINTGRGAVIDTAALIGFIENGKVGGCGLDVYEKEKGVFFYDRSQEPLNDPMLEQLLAFPNVLVTPHQAFATREALIEITATTFANLDAFATGKELKYELTSS